jgi:alkyldihydroxyacetonephosphate synthase
MRWWGWGEAEPMLDAHRLALLGQRVGQLQRVCPPVALSAVRLDPSRLHDTAAQALRAALPDGVICSDHEQRVRHAAGRSYIDLLRLRAGEPLGAPDAVLFPQSAAEIQSVLEACHEHSVAVVPFGGGTSVVGGVEPLRGAHHAVISLDLGRVVSIVRVDRKSLIATAGAGLRVAALERHLATRGLTLGHFPQSFEHVSLGGCAATRSAGQSSTGYGRFTDMVEGLSVLTPTGPLTLQAFAATAAGPDLRELVLGSEGVLGVISQLDLRVRQRPEHELYEGFFFKDFTGGCEALRELAQTQHAPMLTRLSDRSETAISMAMAGSGSASQRIGHRYLALRGYSAGCVAILGFSGSPRSVQRQRRGALEVIRRNGGLSVGRSPGKAWVAQRFSAPYLRDELMTHGVMVETLETATRWSNLLRLHRDVGERIDRELRVMGTPAIVMCHVSHIYETGASLYFTVLALQQPGAEIEQWQSVKRAASEVILVAGGTITHHHAVGSDHSRWLASEIGPEGMRALAALKDAFDPGGIMNPGKLLA